MIFESFRVRTHKDETATSELEKESMTRHSRHYNKGCIARPAIVIRSFTGLFLIADVNKSKTLPLCQFPPRKNQKRAFKIDENDRKGHMSPRNLTKPRSSSEGLADTSEEHGGRMAPPHCTSLAEAANSHGQQGDPSRHSASTSPLRLVQEGTFALGIPTYILVAHSSVHPPSDCALTASIVTACLRLATANAQNHFPGFLPIKNSISSFTFSQPQAKPQNDACSSHDQVNVVLQ